MKMRTMPHAFGDKLQVQRFRIVWAKFFFYSMVSRGVAKGGRSPSQSSEKPFFQNVEIQVENCWGDYLIVKEDQFNKKEEKTPDLIYIF